MIKSNFQLIFANLSIFLMGEYKKELFFAQNIQIKDFPDMSQSKTTLFHEWEGPGFYLAQYKTPELAIYSYYLESEGQAFLVDPTYDTYMYKEIAEKRKAKLISILLTHYHADYIAGHTEFNLPIIMGPKSLRPNTHFKLFEMQNGYEFNLGSVWIKVLHTPGHTPESSCFELIDKEKNPVALFSGDTVFLGEVGRPDLAASQNITKEDLAALLFNSLQKIKKEVNPAVRIYPTHGAGSACGKSIGEGNFCTLEKQLEKNYAFKIQSSEEFIAKIINEMPKAPTYFFYDAKTNMNGPTDHFDKILETSTNALTIENFKKNIDEGCLCIDSRHLPEEVIKNCFMMTQKGALASWVGLIIPPNHPLVLFTEPDRAKDLIERLLRIGYFNIKGFNNFTIADWKSAGNETWSPKYEKAKNFLEDEKRVLLDVRNLGEWKNGIGQNAKTITLGEIDSRHKEVADISNLYINCKSGWRATLAASILARNGVKATILLEQVANFEANGIKVVPYEG